MPANLQLDAVTWTGGSFPLFREVNLTVGRGEIVVISGRGGCGKSTLLEICAGLKRPASGRVRWDGIDINTLSRRELLAARERIGFLFQRHALIANYSIYDNIALPLRTQGSLSDRDIDLRVRAVMEEVALFGVERQFPESLSNGQLKTAALARALSTDPEMLFLDEPLSGVDPRMADGIISVLIGRQRRTPRTFITVSHDVTMWSPLACRTLLIEDCRLVEAGHTQLSVETGAPGNE